MYLLTEYKLKKKYGIPNGKERETLYAAVDDWVEGIGDRAYQGGAHPNAADVSVFGVLRSLEGYDTFDDMLANTRISEWYTRMAGVVGEPARTNPR
jgi:microsomal prostaglandin-E synthase 2